MLLGVLEIDASTLGQQWERERWPEMRAAFESAFKARTRDEWDDLFRDTDACVSPVLTYDEADSHPHLLARHTFSHLHDISQPRPAPRFSRTDPETRPVAASPSTFSEVHARWA